MNNVIPRVRPAARREDGHDHAELGKTPELVAVSGLHPLTVDSTVFAAPDQPSREAALWTNDGSGTSASARDVQPRGPETDPSQPFRTTAFASDPSLVVPVMASPAEILRARELREQLKKKYLNRPSEPCCLWCVGAD